MKNKLKHEGDIHMGSKIIKERSLNLDYIPKKKTKNDWSKSKGCSIPFIYKRSVGKNTRDFSHGMNCQYMIVI